jgi:hypothetical protein
MEKKRTSELQIDLGGDAVVEIAGELHKLLRFRTRRRSRNLQRAAI